MTGECPLSGPGAATKTSPLKKVLTSELVPQSKLHDPRLGQQARVRSETVGRLSKRCEQRRRPDALRIKSRQIQDVEHFPAELDPVGIVVGHLPALGQAHVQTCIAVAAKNVARSHLTG